MNCVVGLSVFVLISLIPLVELYKIRSDHEAMMYLNRFGYVNDEDMSDEEDMNKMKPMLMGFQRMCHINQSGLLDSKTMEMMNAPRCGNLDMNLTHHHTMFLEEHRHNEVLLDRYRRFVVNRDAKPWKSREITYRMGMFSTSMASHVPQHVALEQIHLAFRMWSEVTNLDFVYTPNAKSVNIELSFTTRFHKQDSFPFDGPGNTLAHAFPPGPSDLSGDVHFEDEENWTVDTPKGTNVLYVAVHEIGHALGLDHSMVKGAIMQPFYGGYSPKLRLHPDDVAGVQAIYGKREVRGEPSDAQPQTTVRPTTPRPVPPRAQPPPPRPTQGSVTPKRPDLCKDARVDAVTALKDGRVFVFKGEYVFEIDGKGKGIKSGYPHRIETIFNGLEGNIDGAATFNNGKTYFFKGPYYWRSSRGTEIDPGYPKSIAVHFPGIPNSIDSVFDWDGAVYFTKGDKIWRFDPSTRPYVSDKYPLSLSLWDLGANVQQVDASFTAPNKHIYLFHGETYSRLDLRTFKVSKDLQPSYPRSSKVMWFGCTGGAPVDYREIRQSLPRQTLYRGPLDYYDY